MMSKFDDDRPCTVEELENIITAPSGGFTLLPNSPYDEVVDGIFIGEGDSAKSVNCMKKIGVTYVLNAALGKDIFHVNTNHVMYARANIQFLGIKATDCMNCNLSQYFSKAADFIQEGLESGGKVFVHCVQGVSRSATLVLAFLMIKRHMTVQDALRLVREKREICPNQGFLQQLCNLDEKLKKSKQLHGDSPAISEGILPECTNTLGEKDVGIESDDPCLESEELHLNLKTEVKDFHDFKS